LNFNNSYSDYNAKLQEAASLRDTLRPTEPEEDSEDEASCLMTMQEDFVVVDLRDN